MSESTAVVAFSGGLDTSFVVPFIREQYGIETVVTCTVNTGGFNEEELHLIAKRSKEVGADKHLTVDARQDFYDEIIKYLIYGNVSRDGYPLCTGAERLIQSKKCLDLCRTEGATYLVHGCTGAGNDQYRFEVAVSVLGGGSVKSLAPIRDLVISREKETEFLRERGIAVEDKSSRYSYNLSLWGNWIGGGDTHYASALLPDGDWLAKADPDMGSGTLELSFEQGQVTSLRSDWGNASNPVDIILLLTTIGNKFGIGKHYHVGTSIPGKKGRGAYESPAADLLYEAHRTLEKVTLTQLQIAGKKPMAEEFGRLIHEAYFFDPYFEDIKAFLEHTQKRVTGDCMVYLGVGNIKAVTVKSPYDLLGAKGSMYGETSDFYTGEEARGACILHGFEQMLYHSLKNPDQG